MLKSLQYVVCLIGFAILSSCGSAEIALPTQQLDDQHEFAIEGVNEFLPGDIIVRPNANILPGTARIPGGQLFGHAAMVIRGFRADQTDSLLANTIIIESIARDVQPGFQVRESPALAFHERDAFNNVNFSEKYSGNRYRLRLSWTESELDSLIAFLKAQKGDVSTWNAAKRFPGHPFADSLVRIGQRSNWADNSHWYCSLLVWQAVYYVKGIDLDPNGGYMVYPNDLIASPMFDNKPGHTGRARF
ncbi:MAG TPA: hypothetical protein PKE03_11600 [Bacteroidales bacterium]|nr:hypothetical protein [Bacteroidales bacterium]